MIQRIQSLFLLFAAALNPFLFIFPVWEAPVEKGVFELFIHKIQYPDTFKPLMQSDELKIFLFLNIAAVVILTGLALGVIFMYKNRILQMRLSRMGMFLEAVFLAYLLIFFIPEAEPFVRGEMTGEAAYGVGVFMPMIAIIMFFLANRFILKDEKLVRSADRLR